jgi:hypothetical protein
MHQRSKLQQFIDISISISSIKKQDIHPLFSYFPMHSYGASDIRFYLFPQYAGRKERPPDLHPSSSTPAQSIYLGHQD